MSDIHFSKLTWENLPARTTALSATNLNRIEKGIDDSVNGVNSNSHSIAELQTRISQIASGTPEPVNTIAEMTDHSKIYVYTGSEQGESTGYWYSYDSTQNKFVPGGQYGGAATDPTLSISGSPADSKAVGEALAEKADSSDVTALDTRVTAVERDVDDLEDDLDKYDNPFESTITAYTSGIVSINIIHPDCADFELYRISVIRKNTTWHWYMTLQGFNGESWVQIDDVESPYTETYPRVEVITSKYNKYTVTLDWNYVRAEDISASGLEIIVKNSIVYSPFINAVSDIKTNQTNIATLTSNEQRYNSIFAVTVPDSILGLVDLSIYHPNYSNFEKYRVRNVRHNSSWHIQFTVQGYNGTAWSTVDEVEIPIASAPSPVPPVEVYDSKYHRFYLTIVWAMMGGSITLTSQDYTLKNSVVNKTQIYLRQDVNKLLTAINIPSFELADHVDRTKVIKVKQDGTGDFTTIGAAYASITDSAFDNQYEIIVYPGTYNENNLQPPAYTHTHGIFPMQTIVDSTGSEDVDNSVFDMGHAPCKLSNMWIKSATKYCVHQDVELYAVTLVCENLYCEKLPGGSQLNSACIGMGADFGGAKFIWRGCTFINGEVGMHTNPNQDPNANQHLIFEDCTFVNAYLWLGVAGNTYGEYVCDIRGCKTNKGNAGMRLKFGARISGIPVNFPWQIIGGSNNLAPQFDNTSDTSVSDYWVAINTTEKKYVVATASITKGKFVSDSGAVCNASTPKQNVVGIAVASGSSGDVVPVWSGPIPYTGTAGEYGIDANGELSASASTKIGYVFNNIFYPYYTT